MSEEEKPEPPEWRLVCGEPGSRRAVAGRIAKVYFRGEAIPGVVDLVASFALDDVATIYLSVRPSSFELEGDGDMLMLSELRERARNIETELTAEEWMARDELVGAVGRRLRNLSVERLRQLRNLLEDETEPL